MTPSEIAEISTQVHASLSASLGLTDIDLLDSTAWWREQFESSGNWDAWIWETVTGRDYGTRADHFAGFVVLGDRLGKAGAGIVDLALRRGRVVLGWRPNGPLRVVQTILSVDADDMTSGWAIGDASIVGGSGG